MPSQAQPKPDLINPLAEAERTVFPTPRQLFGLLLGYFALQVVLRTVFSSSVDLDESEQVVLAQRFSLGYGSDPPLYTWLQMPFFRVFGESVLALSLLKNLLLLSTYLLTFATARLVTRSRAAAVAAALSLLCLPQVAWESQRDLTHSILSATLSAATLFCLLRLHEQKSLAHYLSFGLCAGLGLLSKYNYAFWLVGLLLSAASLPEFRPILFNRRMLLAITVMLLVFLPNGLWLLTHRDLALLTSSKFEINQHPGWFKIAKTGVKNIIQSLVSFGAPLAIIYSLLFIRAPKRSDAEPGPNFPYRRLILRAWAIIGCMLVLLVLCARATGFKERWFQPILICLPIVAVSLVQDRLDARRLKCLVALGLVIMIAVATIMPGRLLVAERLKREEPLTRPYATLAAQVRAIVPPGALVVCEPKLLAGNLRLGLRDATFIPPELAPLFQGKYSHCFLAWEAKQSELPPDSLRQWATAVAPKKIEELEPKYFSALYRFHRSKQWRIGLVQLY